MQSPTSRGSRTLKFVTEEGDEVLVYEIQEYRDARTLSDPYAAPMKGLRSLRTADGSAVCPVEGASDEALFKVAVTGEILRLVETE